VLRELYYGARKSAHSVRNLTSVDELAASIKVQDCDAATAQHYGQIKYRLRVKGRPIPENDIWIASVARQAIANSCWPGRRHR
jgi:tRNA(fMet)-specific endonuclease VapC